MCPLTPKWIVTLWIQIESDVKVPWHRELQSMKLTFLFNRKLHDSYSRPAIHHASLLFKTGLPWKMM